MKSPGKRITAEAALEHPWMSGGIASEKVLKVQENLRSWRARMRFKKVRVHPSMAARFKKGVHPSQERSASINGRTHASMNGCSRSWRAGMRFKKSFRTHQPQILNREILHPKPQTVPPSSAGHHRHCRDYQAARHHEEGCCKARRQARAFGPRGLDKTGHGPWRNRLMPHSRQVMAFPSSAGG